MRQRSEAAGWGRRKPSGLDRAGRGDFRTRSTSSSGRCSYPAIALRGTEGASREPQGRLALAKRSRGVAPAARTRPTVRWLVRFRTGPRLQQHPAPPRPSRLRSRRPIAPELSRSAELVCALHACPGAVVPSSSPGGSFVTAAWYHRSQALPSARGEAWDAARAYRADPKVILSHASRRCRTTTTRRERYRPARRPPRPRHYERFTGVPSQTDKSHRQESIATYHPRAPGLISGDCQA